MFFRKGTVDICASSSELFSEMVITIGVISELMSLATLVIGEGIPIEPPGPSVPGASCPECGHWFGVFFPLVVSVIVLPVLWGSVISVCMEVGCSVSPRVVNSWSTWEI